MQGWFNIENQPKLAMVAFFNTPIKKGVGM